jgi:hypothetical protein
MPRIFLRSVLWGLAGSLALPLAGIILLVITGTFLELLGVQGASGGSGGFEMGLANLILLLVPIGAAGFFIGAFIRGIRARAP